MDTDLNWGKCAKCGAEFKGNVILENGDVSFDKTYPIVAYDCVRNDVDTNTFDDLYYCKKCGYYGAWFLKDIFGVAQNNNPMWEPLKKEVMLLIKRRTING